MLAAVLRYLVLDRRVAWASKFNSGAHVKQGVDSRGKPTRRFIRYAFVGCADVLGQMADGRFLAIEVKVGRDTLSGDQEAFLSRVRAAHGVAIEARSIDDVRAALDAVMLTENPR
jgi:hypothetical protein